MESLPEDKKSPIPLKKYSINVTIAIADPIIAKNNGRRDWNT